MYLKIRDEIVRRNVEIFKIILKRASHSAEASQTEKKSQDFKAFVHRLTGEVRFTDLNSEPVDSSDWVVVSFYFSLPENGADSITFEVSGREDALFSWDGFQPQALDALKETVKTIQLMAKFLPALQSLSATFRDFSQVNLDSFLDEIPTKDLIHEAWRQVDHRQCEEILSKKPAGTFLFRQDEFAAILEGQLSEAHKKPLKCITLTYVNPMNRIVDTTLVKKKEGWIVYNDDPCLRGPVYPTVRSLLDSFREVLRVPLLSL
jgi:hypothetical protein